MRGSRQPPARGGRIAAQRRKKKSTKAKVLEIILLGPNDAESIAGEVEISYSTARKLLGEMLREGSVIDFGRSGINRKLYAVPGTLREA